MTSRPDPPSAAPANQLARAVDDDGASTPRIDDWLTREGPARVRSFEHGEAREARHWLNTHADAITQAFDRALNRDDLAAACALGVTLDAVLRRDRGHAEHDAALDALVALAVRRGDREREGDALRLRARAYFLRGDLRAARTTVLRAVQRVHDPVGAREVRLLRSAIERESGEPEVAAETARHVRTAAEQAGDRAHVAAAMHHVAAALAGQGRLLEAREAFLEALAAARLAHCVRTESLCRVNLAVTDARTGQHDLAAWRAEEAAQAFEAIGDRMLAAKSLLTAAEARTRLGEHDRATQWASRAVEIARGLDDRGALVDADLLRARNALARGSFAEAIVIAEEAHACATALGLVGPAAAAHEIIARARNPKALVAGALPLVPALRVEAGARAFAVDGESASVDLRRRPALRRLLDRLVEIRLATPGRACPVSELVRAGWPGERMHASSGAERVYTAIRTLRRLGLAEHLVQRDGGYLLDENRPVVREVALSR